MATVLGEIVAAPRASRRRPQRTACCTEQPRPSMQARLSGVQRHRGIAQRRRSAPPPSDCRPGGRIRRAPGSCCSARHTGSGAEGAALCDGVSRGSGASAGGPTMTVVVAAAAAVASRPQADAEPDAAPRSRSANGRGGRDDHDAADCRAARRPCASAGAQASSASSDDQGAASV